MSDTPARTRETILVVDDNALVLRFVVAILKDAHFQVLSAQTEPVRLKLRRKLTAESTSSFPTWICLICQARTWERR